MSSFTQSDTKMRHAHQSRTESQRTDRLIKRMSKAIVTLLVQLLQYLATKFELFDDTGVIDALGFPCLFRGISIGEVFGGRGMNFTFGTPNSLLWLRTANDWHRRRGSAGRCLLHNRRGRWWRWWRGGLFRRWRNARLRKLNRQSMYRRRKWADEGVPLEQAYV